MTDIATRVHDHNWRIDPIVRSLLDTDFYKLLMLQTVYRRHPDVTVEFSLINRSKDVPLARLIDEDDLRAQLDHIRGLRLTRGEFDLAARQHLLRQALDVRAGLHGLARGLPHARVPARAARRPVRADASRARGPRR